MVESARRLFRKPSEKRIVDVREFYERYRRHESEEFLHQIEQRIGEKQENAVDKQIYIKHVVERFYFHALRKVESRCYDRSLEQLRTLLQIVKRIYGCHARGKVHYYKFKGIDKRKRAYENR